jgi:hypothetical protein
VNDPYFTALAIRVTIKLIVLWVLAVAINIAKRFA